jgi:hypothetical protein
MLNDEDSPVFVQQVNVLSDTNIYAALEFDQKCSLEGWEHTRGQPRVDAECTNWFKHIPPVLFMRINRTKYNYGGYNQKM